MSEKRLGELLVRKNIISLEQLRFAQDEQRKTGGALGYNLAKLGIVSDETVTEFLSQQYRVPAINLADFEIDPEVARLVSKEVATKHKVIPVSRAGASLIVAMADPTNLHAIDDIKFLTGYNVEPVVASETAILDTIQGMYDVPTVSYEDVMEGFNEEEIAYCEDDDNVNELELAK